MKFYYRIWVDQKNVSPELYQQIIQLRPEGHQKDHFTLESQPGDDSNAALIVGINDLCSRHSLKNTGVREFGTYMYEVVRHYEAADLAAAQFLILQTQKRMFHERLERNESGLVILPAREAGTSIKVASGQFNNWFVASGEVRRVLEAGRLTGLLFRATVLKGTSIRATTEPLWEIDSDVNLPKMVNSSLNPHSKVPCYFINELPYRRGEPHYHQNEILSLGEFDVARTFETLSSEPAMVVSQRFYQLCLANEIQLEARPVRIDPN